MTGLWWNAEGVVTLYEALNTRSRHECSALMTPSACIPVNENGVSVTVFTFSVTRPPVPSASGLVAAFSSHQPVT